jgi:aspartyl-tRNA(Asn)/glutamyl-tRNA(Gln) amidotransferase subunit A
MTAVWSPPAADPSAVARDVGARLRAAEPLNATLHWSEAALQAEAARVNGIGRQGPLHGMPIALKDNLVTAEQPTTCGSSILEGYVSPFTGTAVARLREAGALVAGKANMDEFAMGSSTEHSAYGRVKHPLDPERVPGGSSGGSAALVAAGVVPAALGSETGGSGEPVRAGGVRLVARLHLRVRPHGE